MKIRPDKAATLLLDAGLACMGTGVIAFLVALLGGEYVQTPLYFLLSFLAHLLLLVAAGEVLCLVWGAILLAASRPHLLAPSLAGVLVRSVLAALLLIVLSQTRLIWVAPAGYMVFQVPLISPAVFVLGKLHPLSAAQSVGAGLLFYGGILLGWAAATVIPLASRAVGGPARRSLREDLRRQSRGE